MAQLAEISGRVSLEETKKAPWCNVTITADDGEWSAIACPTAPASGARTGDHVEKGDQLTAGALYPHDVLRIRGSPPARST